MRKGRCICKRDWKSCAVPGDTDFEGDNLVASGVEMEGWSVEDEGAGICFYVYCYNVQPGIGINYADGTSWESEIQEQTPNSELMGDNKMKRHRPIF